MKKTKLVDIAPPNTVSAASQIVSGKGFQPIQLIGLYSADEWEQFVEEWAQGLGSGYHMVRRLSGSGDKGLDVVAFTKAGAFDAPWDSYQCKHYSNPLVPSNIWIELGKIIYFSFKKESPFDGKYSIPRFHYFVAPKDVGLKAQKLLLSPSRLRTELIKNWEKHCEKKLGANIQVPLDKALLGYIENFDFSIFSYKSALEIVAQHKKTNYYSTRFGVALPEKAKNPPVPHQSHDEKAFYVRKLLDAYSQNQGVNFAQVEELDAFADIKSHFDRQRELFHSAEFLRNYARDSVPNGTFEALMDDIYHGVIDTVDKEHNCGLTRVKATISKAADVGISGNALQSVTVVKEKQGICHQLANDDKLTWKK